VERKVDVDTLQQNFQNDKNIVFFIGGLDGGGAENVCINISNFLAKKGWNVTLLVLNTKEADYLHKISPDVYLHDLGISNAKFSLYKIWKYIYSEQPKFFLVFGSELSTLLVILRMLTLNKFKIIARNTNTHSYKRKHQKVNLIKYFALFIVDLFFPKVDHVINQCEGMDLDLIKNYPSLKGKTTVINNPVNSNVKIFLDENKATLYKKDNYILFIGRLEAQKGAHYAIEAFSKIKNNYHNLRLKIVGKGSLEAELMQLCHRLGVANRVDFEGFSNNVEVLYLQARLTILSSLYEGFPNVLVESISLGTPILAFDCPSGPSEIIIQGVNGYLANYLDVDDLAIGISQVIDLNNFAEIQASAKKYSIEGIVKAYIDIIKLHS
jgi:glycosyltransferase involved in cell wall biosynthesis